jgi:hypothetical protein
MKTNRNPNVPFHRLNQFPADAATPSAGTSTTRISENAFYLIVLATLLKKKIGARAVQELLVPGKYVGAGFRFN